MIKHIVFDFDGTIVDSTKIVFNIYKDLAQKYGFKNITIADLEGLRTLSVKERCRKLGIPFYKLTTLGIEVKNKYGKYISALKPIAGIEELINELKNQDYFLYIISSNSVANINSFLDKNNFNLFNGIYSSSSFFGKYLTIKSFLKKHNLNKTNMIYIGDEYRDIIACKKAGVKIAAATWGYDTADFLSQNNPDFLLYSPSDLLKYLPNIS